MSYIYPNAACKMHLKAYQASIYDGKMNLNAAELSISDLTAEKWFLIRGPYMYAFKHDLIIPN